MPLDDQGRWDIPAPWPTPAAAAPAQAPAPAQPTDQGGGTPMRDRIAAARQAGYTSAEIADHFMAAPSWQPKLQAAQKAGYTPAQVFAHLGVDVPPEDY